MYNNNNSLLKILAITSLVIGLPFAIMSLDFKNAVDTKAIHEACKSSEYTLPSTSQCKEFLPSDVDDNAE